jgi:hypothetical protein
MIPALSTLVFFEAVALLLCLFLFDASKNLTITDIDYRGVTQES